MSPARVRLLPPIVGVALIFAACGSAATSSPVSTSPSASTAASAAAASAAASAAAPTVAATALATSSAVGSSLPPVGDVGNSATNLSNLTSYKVAITLGGGTSAGTATMVVVRKPTLARSFTADFGGQTLRIIIIGSTTWVDEGSGTYVKNAVSPSSADAMTAGFDPGTILAAANSKGQLGLLQTVGLEQKNGVQALHLHGDHSTPMPSGEPTISPGGTLDLWVAADGGYLVAVEVNGLQEASGETSVSIEVTNINDPSLTVTAPG